MQFTATIVSAALSMVLAPTGAMAWAQAENGIWTANNVWYDHVGDHNNVHESCTRMNSEIVLTDGPCAYWTDDKGTLGHGYCNVVDDRVECKPGCPDPSSSCQYLRGDGTCDIGYSGCLRLFGCSGEAGEADCLGLATGCLHCKG